MKTTTTILTLLVIFTFSLPLFAQQIDIESTTQGALLPRMTTTQRTAITTPSQSELVYDTNTKTFWYFDDSQWNELGAGGGTGGNSDEIVDTDNDTKIQAEESADEDIIRYDIGGTELLQLSKSAAGRLLVEPQNGFFGTFYGFNAGKNSTGDSNSLFGHEAGKSLTSGFANTIIGTQAGENLSSGDYNVLLGKFAGRMTNGNSNTYLGYLAGINNSAGSNNVMVGVGAGDNSTGGNNVFLGSFAGANETGDQKLYIDATGTGTATPLIHGDFVTDKVGINTNGGKGTLQIEDPNSQLTSLYLTPKAATFNDSSSVFFAEDKNGAYGMEILYDGASNQLQIFGEVPGSRFGPHMSISRDNGQVAIGGIDYASGYALSVNGKIAAEEVMVDLVGDWPDYVFENEYPLRSLAEVQNHISEKGHLPGVPSAAEVETNGIQVGAMNKILMEKVEELTLYILDQEKRMLAQEARLHKLEEKQ